MMERNLPRPGDKYMHFKGKAYQIVCVAYHSETRERMVAYQALYGSFECFVRPLASFMSQVDRKKYPQSRQKYRFELMEESPAAIEPVNQEPDSRQAQTDASKMAQQEEQANPALLQFLDADTLEEKYHVIKSLGNAVTDRLIDDFAVVLDLVIPEGSLDMRYQQLLSSVRTMQKFESTRLRTWQK